MQNQSKIITLTVFFFLGLTLHGQKTNVPMNEDSWEVNAKKSEFMTYKGQQCLFLSQGSAMLQDVSLSDGIIEFDFILPDNRQFSGITFRLQDGKNYEEFYMRPHQNAKADAVQYTPVFNGSTGWQLYFGDGHWANYDFKFEEWLHFKMILSNDQAEIYIDDMNTPAIYCHDLKHEKASGALGLESFMGGMHVANFSYQKMDNPPLKSPAREMPALESGTITSWSVSNAFEATKIEEVYQLQKEQKKDLKWTDLEVESDGTANLARVNGHTQEINTVFARLSIQSDKAQIRKLDLGFSDAVQVYCNDQLIYSGNDKYASRDYRYLGSIGYFDSVYLPLKKGTNEVWFAVTEAFGGWGLKAKMEDRGGITLK